MRPLFIFIALLLLSLVGHVHAQPLPLAEVRYQSVDREQVFDAVLEAVHQATVSAQTAGRVIEINYDVDDYVAKDSVILRLRDTEQRAALQAAQARYHETQAEFERTQDIYRKKLVAKAALDKAEAAFKSATAALAQTREQLAHTVVKAPYSGIVVKRHIQPGEVANPGQPLMTGISLEQLRAVVQVPQMHISAIRSLGRAQVLLPQQPALDGGKLTFSPHADPLSHTFPVRVELPPGQHGVYPGMFAKVAFVVGQERRLLVPAQAVVLRSEVSAVYVVDGAGRVSFRQVRLGRNLSDGSIEVLAGLEEGEQVALEPVRAGVQLKQTRAGSR